MSQVFSTQRRLARSVANAAWWGLLVLLPLAAVLLYGNIWSLGTQTCDESFGHYAGDAFVFLIFLVFGIPAAYLVQGVALFLGRSRSRPFNLGVVTVLLALSVLLALALTLRGDSSPACPTGLPTWWPDWLPHV